jgi:hypothetical protein
VQAREIEFLRDMVRKNSQPCRRSQNLWSHLGRDTTLIGDANAENAETLAEL